MDDDLRSGHGLGLRAVLRVPAFSLLLGVQLVNAVAVWVHVVSVQWMLTAQAEPATVVALAPAAMALPFLLLALPVGVVVGYASRERLLMLATLASGFSALLAMLLTGTGTTHPAAVLGTVVVVGMALVVVGVSWQSLLPEMVDRSQVPSAALLDGAVYNIARAVGPLVAGVGLGLYGPVATFGLVAGLFGSCVLVLIIFGRRRPGRRGPRRPIVPAIRVALHFTRHSPWTRRLLWRMTMFGMPASALWALISLVVHDRLQLSSHAFGVMMALLGGGAVVGTLMLGPFRRRLTVRVFAAGLSLLYAAALAALGLLRSPEVVAVFMVLGGIAWVGVQSTWMMLAHQALPDWVRPRIIALVLFSFQGTQAVGSVLWGAVADIAGLSTALLSASALMVLSVGILLRSGLGSSVGIEPLLTHAHADASVAALVSRAGEGELLVRYEYDVAVEQHDTFHEAMGHLRLSRLRLGAREWTLHPHPERSTTYIESYRVTDRDDLLEQESVRLTVPEERLRHAVRAVASRVLGPVLLPAPRNAPQARRYRRSESRSVTSPSPRGRPRSQPPPPHPTPGPDQKEHR